MTLYVVVPRALPVAVRNAVRMRFSRNRSVVAVTNRRNGERRRLATASGDAPPAEQRRADRRSLSAGCVAPDLPEELSAYTSLLRFRVVSGSAEASVRDAESLALADRARKEDSEAFGELYRRYHEAVRRHLELGVGDANEAENLMQDVFLAAAEALPGYELQPGVPFRAWLFAIARNVLRDELARRARIELRPRDGHQASSEGPSVAGADLLADHWLGESRIATVVDRLSASQQRVLVLRYLFELRTQEIAAILDMSGEAVRTQLSRALRTLKPQVAILGYGPLTGTRRLAMGTRLRPLPVLGSRRFSLWSSPGRP